jgi:integrase
MVTCPPIQITVWGVQQLMQRLASRTGIPVHPHKLRHTWATRCVDAGIPVFHLQQAGGWSSLEMVRCYYTAHDTEMLRSFSRATDA